MFSALVKAFTGRAGFFASLLALSLIGLTVAAVLLNLPKIEQKLQASSEQVLLENMATGDSLESLRTDGRNLIVTGEFADAVSLRDKLASIEGVRRVDIIETGVVPAPASESPPNAASDQVVVADTDPVATDQAETDQAETVLVTEAPEELAIQPAQEEALPPTDMAQSADAISNDAQDVSSESSQPMESSVVSDAVVSTGDSSTGGGIDQSTLTLRYDGTRLKLSGHLADEQLAQRVADEIRQVVPAFSEIEIELDGEGKGSPLNWMTEFFAAVSGLPNDAQGVIEGSDLEGVKIIPDAEQTLVSGRQSEAPLAPQPEGSNLPDSADAVVDSGSPPGDVNTGPDEPLVESPRAQIERADEAGEEPGLTQVLTAEIAEPSETVETTDSAVADAALMSQPEVFITHLNVRVADQPVFESGAYAIGPVLEKELDSLAEMMRQNPNLLLRVVGNLDFSVEQRFAEFVGIDRAREIRNYLYRQGIEPFRIFATPLPRDRAFDKRVQVVFYISE